MKKLIPLFAMSLFAGALSMTAAAEETSGVVLNPEGDKVAYDKTYVVSLGSQTEEHTAEAELVINGNDYYFPNFIDNFETPEENGYGYVTGTKIGSRVWVTLPQVIFDDPDAGGKFTVTLAKYEEDTFMGFPGYVPVENPEEICFTIGADNSLVLRELPEGQFLIVENEGLGCTMGVDVMTYMPKNAEPAETIITNPAGDAGLYKKTYVFTMFGQTMEQTADAEIVFGKDNDVYFKDILSQFGDGEEVPHYYVKGIRQGNKITVEYPQLIANVEGNFYMWLGKDAYGTGSFDKAAESGSFTFTIGDDDIITLDKLADDEAIINMSEGMFMYCAEVAMKYTPINTGVDSAVEAGPLSSEYYNLDGCRVAEPANGLYVRRDIMSDGSTVVRKIVVRK